MNRKPELLLLVAGLQKAGTTSLHSALKKSKKFSLPHDKELVTFFSSKYSTIKDVENLFAKGNEYVIVSPQAGISKTFLNNITKIFCTKATDVVLLKRNPVERTISHIGMLIRRGDLSLNYETIKDRFLNDYKSYKDEVTKNSFKQHIDLENVILNSDINFYRRFLIEEGFFSNDKIKIMNIKICYMKHIM